MSKVDDINEPLVPKKEHVNQCLDDKQINYALQLCEERHKLKETPIEVTWPFLKWICCCIYNKRKPNFKFGLKRALRRKLELKVCKSDIEIE